VIMVELMFRHHRFVWMSKSFMPVMILKWLGGGLDDRGYVGIFTSGANIFLFPKESRPALGLFPRSQR
jgi:hypothetical protein